MTMPPTAFAAQARPAPVRDEAQRPPPVVVDDQNARQTRERLREIFEQYPPSVSQVLRLDPSLVSRPEYLAPYPMLAAFMAQHPEIAHSPVFFLGSGRIAPSGPESAKRAR